MIKKICHISDIHIRKTPTRNDEYLNVFKDLINSLKIEKPDRIVIVGDLVHDYLDLQGEQLILAHNLLHELSEIAPVRITRGNHDMRKKNLNRVDSVNAIVKTLKNPNIIYYDRTDVFYDDNIAWFVWHHGDVKHNPWKTKEGKLYEKTRKDGGYVAIDLFHNPINGCVSSTGFEMNSGLYHNISDFNGDFAFLGDIHKMQYLNKNKTIAYSGSLISQDFGEGDDNFHGYLMWNVEDGTCREIPISNDYSYKNIKITTQVDFDDLDIAIKNPTNYMKVRVIWQTLPQTRNADNERKVTNNIKSKYNNVIFSHKNDFVEVDKIEIKDKITIKNINDKQTQHKIFKEYLLKIGVEECVINDVIKLDEEIIKLVDIPQDSGVEWDVVKFGAENFMSYEKLDIDWENMEGLFQITGINTAGKCVHPETEIDIEFNIDYIVNKLGYLPNELHSNRIKIKECYEIFKRYGDLLLSVNTPYGYKHIEACDVTAYQSTMVRIITNDNKSLICSPNHRVMLSNGKFMRVNELVAHESEIMTIDGVNLVISIENIDGNEDLLDIQVADVQQYYSNGILSHNSTILKLISYLLFGKTLETESRMKFGDLRYINNRNQATCTDGYMVIVANGEYYGIKKKTEIIRNKNKEITNVSTTLNYYVLTNGDDVMMESNALEKLDEDRRIKTQKKIDEIIGSYENFKRIVLTTSDTLNNILKNDMSEFIDSLLYDSGLDIFDKKIEGLKQYVKSQNNKSRVVCDVDVLNENTNTLKNEINQLLVDISEIENIIIPNIKNKIKIGKEYVEEHIKKLYKIDSDIYSLNVTEVRETIEEYNREVIALNMRNIAIKEEITQLKSTYDEERLIELLEKKENHKIVENTLKYNIKTIERNIIDCQQKIAIINGDIIRLKEQGTKLKNEVIELKNSKNCPTCGQMMDEQHIAHIGGLIELKMNEMLTIADNIKNKESEKDVPNDEIIKLKNEIIEMDEKIRIHSNDMEEMLFEIGKLTNDKNDVIKYTKLRGELEQIPQTIENWELKISILNGKITNYENSLKQIEENKNNEKIIENSKLRLGNLEMEEKQILESLLIKRNQINERENKIKANNVTIDDFKKQEYQDMVLGLYKKCVHRDGIPKQMLTNYVIPKINNTLLNMLETTHFKVWLDNEDLRPKLSYNSRPDAIIDCISASGKERTFAAIVLKFALNQVNVKSKPQFFLLDEVMGKLIDDSVEEFIEILKLIKNNMRRVLIIEHHAEVSPDWLINVSLSDSGISSVVLE